MIKRKINIEYLVKIRKYYTSIYYLNTFYNGLFVYIFILGTPRERQ